MHTFKRFLLERVLSIGINPNHDSLRSKHEDELHDIMHKSYQSIGGYRSLSSGSTEESNAIRSDIRNRDHSIKLTRNQNGAITSAVLYKSRKGRKLIAAGTNGTPEGKHHFTNLIRDDAKMKRAWGEFSGPLKGFVAKHKWQKIKTDKMKKLLNKKDIKPTDDGSYTRDISGTTMKKSGFGVPQEQCDICDRTFDAKEMIFAEGVVSCKNCVDT